MIKNNNKYQRFHNIKIELIDLIVASKKYFVLVNKYYSANFVIFIYLYQLLCGLYINLTGRQYTL
jgi:hypothetical protein